MQTTTTAVHALPTIIPRRRLTAPTLGRVSLPSLRASRVISDALRPGEEVLAYAEGLVRARLRLFERCVVVLTQRRLLILQPRWPFGYKLDRPFEVTGDTLVNSRQRVDRSTLAIVHDGPNARCLYFPRSWRRQAEEMLRYLGSAGS